MGAIAIFLRRALMFLPFTAALWFANSLPTLTLSQTSRTLLYLAAAFVLPVTMDLIGGVVPNGINAASDIERPLAEYAWAPRLLAAKFVFIQALMLYCVWRRHAVGIDLAVLALLVGLYYGTMGIAVAHELMHRPSRFDRWLGDFLLITVTYPHFSIEHPFGHHINVATPVDPASARLGESLYAFLPRSILGSLRSAWAIEVKRLKARGRGWLSLQNRMLGYLVLVCAYYAGAYLICGAPGMIAVAIQSAVAIFSLETVNYMQHYGLQRKEIAPGRYERPDVMHAWNWETRFSGYYFLNLGRHSEHHRNASRRYDTLRVLDGQPMLPGGLIPMYLTAMIPPLWFRIMNPKVEAIRAGRTLAAPAPGAQTAQDRRRVQVRGLFDRWGGYLIGLLVIAMIYTSGRLGFQGAVLLVLGVAIATVLFRETFVRLPIAAGPLTPSR
ncbi:MAG TPA: alkane 1-monooxygenase [Caulobacteraceae bacterium]|nr:alkane 1-monooxygenase [Caulobacteraceae bacterium]